MKRQQGKREASGCSCQTLQTGGPSPKPDDVLRLPNRDLSSLRIQRCMFNEMPHLMAIPCRFEIE